MRVLGYCEVGWLGKAVTVERVEEEEEEEGGG